MLIFNPLGTPAGEKEEVEKVIFVLLLNETTKTQNVTVNSSADNIIFTSLFADSLGFSGFGPAVGLQMRVQICWSLSDPVVAR